MPRVALESERIARRHVHALLLGRFFGVLGAPNPIHLKCHGFLGLDPAGRAPSERFVAWLEGSAANTPRALHDALAQLVRGTSLEGATVAATLLRAAETFRADIEAPYRGEHERQLAEIGALAAADAAARKALEFALRRIEDAFLLKHLTARAWLPAHGFPTDVLPFVPDCRVDRDGAAGSRSNASQNTAREDDLGTFRDYPSRNLAVAISEYAPGAGVVINGRVRTSAGVTLNWKLPPTAFDPKAEIQSLREAWRCGACGEIDDA